MEKEIKKINPSIIIVSYNTADLIKNCLQSIYPINELRKEIFVVDNASTDGSPDLIRKQFPSVHLIINTENRGFGAANNQAIPLCRGRFIFFLNPDTEFLGPGFGPMISFMDENPQVGLAGIRIVDRNGTPQESYSDRYPGQRYTTGELSGLKGKLAWVLGAGMIARTDLIRKLGGFDEDFFLYGEEQDLCLRIRKAGFEIGYIESVSMVHHEGQSERTSSASEVWRKKALAEYTFYRKHYLPETIRKIARAQLMQAYWRIATLRLLGPFTKDRKSAMAKLAKYRATIDTIREFYRKWPVVKVDGIIRHEG